MTYVDNTFFTGNYHEKIQRMVTRLHIEREIGATPARAGQTARRTHHVVGRGRHHPVPATLRSKHRRREDGLG